MDDLNINFELLEACKAKIGKEEKYKDEKIETIPCVDESNLTNGQKQHYEEIGRKIISQGKYAVVTMAGGQRNKAWL